MGKVQFFLFKGQVSVQAYAQLERRARSPRALAVRVGVLPFANNIIFIYDLFLAVIFMYVYCKGKKK
jgi:hypothetical protein